MLAIANLFNDNYLAVPCREPSLENQQRNFPGKLICLFVSSSVLSDK